MLVHQRIHPTAPKAEVFGAQAIVDNQFFWTLMSYWATGSQQVNSQ